MNTSDNREFEGDAGAPLPDFSSARGIQLQTVAPALGVPRSQQQQSKPDYLDYDTKGRGLIVTMFANAGMSYLLGTLGGGVYGVREGLTHTPSTRFRVKLNSVLNHAGRYGSLWGNRMGTVSVLYSLWEGAADHFELDEYTGPIQPASPLVAAFLTGATYYSPAGARAAALAGSLGVGAVGVTYTAYSLLGRPYGSAGFLFF